jgi:hypothetical protein
MRFYRVLLKVAGPVYLEADSYHWGESAVHFFREHILFAQYPAGLVEEVTEMDEPPTMTSFFTSEGQVD